jgi:hypothetical protein
MNSEKFILEAYRAILRREPTKAEVANMKKGMSLGNHSGFHVLRDMVDSNEFKMQILPGLVVQQTDFGSQPTFFLHIPKTGGTSMRELIGESFGVPSINIYGNWIDPSRGQGYWPYWAGHAQVSFFPETHRGFTLFRDTRSRILSLYREQQGRLTSRTLHGWIYPESNEVKRESLPFSDWLIRRENSGQSSLEFYLAENKNLIGRIRDQNQANELKKTELAERKILLESGLSRFASAAWIHRESDVQTAISSLTGKEVSSLPRQNTFESKEFKLFEVSLTASDLQIIKVFEERDELALKIAADLGLIQLLPKDENEYLFEKTASRLKFKL